VLSTQYFTWTFPTRCLQSQGRTLFYHEDDGSMFLETSVHFYQTTQSHILAGSTLCSHSSQKFKSPKRYRLLCNMIQVFRHVTLLSLGEQFTTFQKTVVPLSSGSPWTAWPWSLSALDLWKCWPTKHPRTQRNNSERINFSNSAVKPSNFAR
jgi:hypothetical protein